LSTLLGALDDKIELNRRTNETLEALARAIFRDWFVDFGPTRAKAEGREPYLAPELWDLFPDRLDAEGKPEGWVRTTAGNFFRLPMGQSPPA
jgi:type I restriction enzyme S subunit